MDFKATGITEEDAGQNPQAIPAARASRFRNMPGMRWVAAIIIIAAAVLLAIWFALRFGGTDSSRYPLPLEVEPADSGEVLARLAARGISSAGYDPDSRRILVSGEDEKKAVIALAEERFLGWWANQLGFPEMLERWAFQNDSDFGNKNSAEAMRQRRINETARLIESMDGTEKAVVLHHEFGSLDVHRNVVRKVAAVWMKLEQGASLDEESASTIISIVAASMPGLDPRNVSVSDQFGNKFHASHYNLFHPMNKRAKVVHKRKWELEIPLNAELRRKLENIVRQYVPNIQYGGDVNVFPRHEVSFSYFEIHNGTTHSPSISDLTVSVIIYLPYRLKRDGEGRPVQQANEYGEALINPETRLPFWERESIEPLSPSRIEELKRQIADASGILRDEIPEKIEIYQVPWTAPAASGIAKWGSFSMLLKLVRGFLKNDD